MGESKSHAFPAAGLAQAPRGARLRRARVASLSSDWIAQALGADLGHGVELQHVGQGADTITAQLGNRDSGFEYRMTADYLIAADGATGGIREALGI